MNRGVSQQLGHGPADARAFLNIGVCLSPHPFQPLDHLAVGVGNLDVKRVIELVDEIEKNDANWEQFATHFDELNNDFIKKLKKRFAHLTSTDLKMCAYLQLKLASKEIAQLMNISVRGVEISRYRLRKKLQIPTKQTLNDFLNDVLEQEG